MQYEPGCNIKIIQELIKENKRADERQMMEGQKATILFTPEFGTCFVELGKTKVVAHVTCELSVPKIQRPAEGTIFINVELSPMASPQFEAGRTLDFTIEIGRLLERCIKESQAVDLESLCLIEGQKVWRIRVDVHILDHGGSMLDCASIATIAALSHFRYPEVTVTAEGDVKIHSFEEKYPHALNLQFIPFCVSFAFFGCGGVVLEPSSLEEKASIGKLIVGANAHRETCLIHIGGSPGVNKDKIFLYCNKAIERATHLTEQLREVLQKEEMLRKEGKSSLEEALALKEKLFTAEPIKKPRFLKPTFEDVDMRITTEDDNINSLTWALSASGVTEDESKMEQDQDVDMRNLPGNWSNENVVTLGPGVVGIGENYIYEWYRNFVYRDKMPPYKGEALEGEELQNKKVASAILENATRNWYPKNWW